MSMHHTSIRWANVELDRETELAAIKETIELVEKIKRALKSGVELQQSENLCTIDFDTFESEHMDFILATLGVGEARIVLRKDDVRMAETGISGVWKRMAYAVLLQGRKRSVCHNTIQLWNTLFQ